MWRKIKAIPVVLFGIIGLAERRGISLCWGEAWSPTTLRSFVRIQASKSTHYVQSQST